MSEIGVMGENLDVTKDFWLNILRISPDERTLRHLNDLTHSTYKGNNTFRNEDFISLQKQPN